MIAAGVDEIHVLPSFSVSFPFFLLLFFFFGPLLGTIVPGREWKGGALGERKEGGKETCDELWEGG